MKSENQNHHNDIAGLYSGDILRAVVQALDIESAELRNRNGQAVRVDSNFRQNPRHSDAPISDCPSEPRLSGKTRWR